MGMFKLSQSLLHLLIATRIKPYHTFDQIAESFWFLIKLELYLEIGIMDPNHPLQPAATYASVSYLWDYIWVKMKQRRETHPWACPTPRLREMIVVAGSFRSNPPTEPLTWEQTQQQRFRASAHGGEEKRGLADVTCLEVEALMKGIEEGDLEYAIRRATYGASNDPKPDYEAIAMRIAASAPTPGD